MTPIPIITIGQYSYAKHSLKVWSLPPSWQSYTAFCVSWGYLVDRPGRYRIAREIGEWWV